MAWIKVDQSLARHRKTLLAADLLGINRHQVVGHLVELWSWAVDNVPSTGSLDGLTASHLKEAAGWPRAAAKFEAALIEAGFIDAEPRGLHDWGDYAGRLSRQREQNRTRQRRHRQRDVRVTGALGHGPVTRDVRVTGALGHGPVTRDVRVTGALGHAPRVDKSRDQEGSLTREEDGDGVPQDELDRPQSQTEFETALRRAPTHEDRDQLVLEAFFWQHNVVPVEKKRQALLGYCRSYGHAHVLATVFRAGDRFPDHPESYVLAMLATPPARDPEGASHKRRSELALAELERMEMEAES